MIMTLWFLVHIACTVELLDTLMSTFSVVQQHSVTFFRRGFTEHYLIPYKIVYTIKLMGDPTYLHTLSVGSFMYGRFDVVGVGRNNLPYNSYRSVVLIIVCYTVPSAHTLADLCCLW